MRDIERIVNYVEVNSPSTGDERQDNVFLLLIHVFIFLLVAKNQDSLCASHDEP